MYNVVVVDDETWICKLIRKIVDWEALGLNIIANAGDGLTALELIEEHRPDLVITDIRMPGLDGIGLIKAVRERKLDVEFIIISGYSDFEYARSALTFDAFGYLLKPLDKEEFEDILCRVKDKLGKKRVIKTKIETVETVMLENDLRKIIDRVSKDISVGELNRQYCTKFEDGLFCAAIFKRDFITRDKKEGSELSGYQDFLAETKNRLTERFKEAVFFPGKMGDQELFIINIDENDDNIYAAMKDALKAFESRCPHKEYSLTICIGSRVADISEIDTSYEAALEAMKARVYLGTGGVIDAEKETYKSAEIKDVIDIRSKKKLTVLLDVLDIEGASLEISRIFAEADKRSAENQLVYHITAYEIIDILFSTMQRKGIGIRSGISKQQAAERVDGYAVKSEIENYVCSLLKEFGSVYVDEKHDNGEKLIIKIKKFISENYMSNINLDDIAKLVCLSPTYVSEVFKRKTGENFSEYLIDYRIEIAKDVLKDIRFKVVDVSLMVGYRDSKYFGRLFKKKVGVNPSDYRKFYL